MNIATARRALLLASAALAWTSAPYPAAASTLRAVTTLTAPTVKVADLFDDTGSGGARILGAAPAPGARIVIEAAQLAAIARQFGIDWRPTSSADHVVLERPGRPLARAAILETLRAALAGVGAPADGDIEIPGFSAPMIAQDSHPELGVEQVDYDASTGRFTASFVLSGPEIETQHMRVSGRIDEMVDVVVPLRRLAPGAVISADALRTTRLRATGLRGDMARTPDQVIGRALRHAGAAGQPIALAEVTRPADIHKGDRVAIELNAPGLALSTVGLAMEDGASGDRITVLNPASRAVFEVDVLGAGRVRVTPGSLRPSAPRVNLAASWGEP